MKVKLMDYDPNRHYDAVADLWERTLGDKFGVTDRILRPRIWTRPSLEPGDGVVALNRRRVVGFGMIEFSRDFLVPPTSGSIEALVVDPAFQRRRVGSQLLARLEDRLRGLKCQSAAVGCGLYRFWSGTPVELPAATAFFESHAYASNYDAIDMVAPLADFQIGEPHKARLREKGAVVESVKPDEIGRLFDFLTREALGWRESMLRMVAAGDAPNALVVRRGDELIGCIQTFIPTSRFRYANLVWERVYGENLGGFGAVLIAKDWRKQGLGVAMIQAAAQHVKDHGGSHCFIDWTSHSLAPFYAKTGARICGVFKKHAKSL